MVRKVNGYAKIREKEATDVTEHNAIGLAVVADAVAVVAVVADPQLDILGH